jgi:thiosulfate/3-mercaptopyruvate sulfurtransferase
MAFTTLISTDALADRLSTVSIVDCRFRLDDVTWGEREWRAGHIPGAVYAHLDRDLSGPKSGTNGRHPLPAVDALGRTLGRFGIANGRQVVAYDQDTGMFASRLWWLLRWVGHDEVAVLDGGLAKWIAEGRPLSAGDERIQPVEFCIAARTDMTASADEVAAHLGDANWRLIDARAPERYRGEVEPIDPVAGHIPSAVNHFFQSNIDSSGVMRAPEELRARFRALVGEAPPGQVVTYCGSGVQACQNLLAMAHAGITGARLYPGSWSEWTSDRLRPIETASPARTGKDPVQGG